MAEISYLMRQPRAWLVPLAALCVGALVVVGWQLTRPDDQTVLSQGTEQSSTEDAPASLSATETDASDLAARSSENGEKSADPEQVALVVSGDGGSELAAAGADGSTSDDTSINPGQAPAGAEGATATTLADHATPAGKDTPTTSAAVTRPSADTTVAENATTTKTVVADETAPTPGSSTSGYFATLPPGSVLPSGADCASRVRPAPENVPETEPYNTTRGTKVTGTYLSTNTAIAKNNYEARIDGNFVGSTDEIIQWAACKWGFDEDHVRATVYTESSWYAGKLGDCGEQTHERTGGAGGCSSVGLIQVRSAETGKSHHPGVYPIALDSSAMNLDYALAIKRLCYEGMESWLSKTAQAPGGYTAGDEWNCMGRWFSGNFGDSGAQNYLANLRKNLNERPWEGQWVGCKDWRDSFHCSGISRPRIG